MPLPDDIRDRIDADPEGTLLEPIAEILYEKRDRPFFSKRHIESRLRDRYNQETTTKTIGDRLDELMADEWVTRKRVGGTDIFYWNDDASEWPIPPDVEVEPKRLEPTVSEWFDRDYVTYAVGAIAVILVGSIITFVALFDAAGVYDLPIPLDASVLFGLAFWAIVISYLALLYSAWIALRRRGAIPGVRLES